MPPPTRLEVSAAAARGGQPRPGRRGRLLYARGWVRRGRAGGVDGLTQPANWMMEIYAEMAVPVRERT
jgi:hypothetical protein